MAGEKTKIEDDESDHQIHQTHQTHQTSTQHFSPPPPHPPPPTTTSESITKSIKSKSHSHSHSHSHSKDKDKDKDKGTSSAAASAKRRCVSTACIACRRRKSKVKSSPSPISHLPSPISHLPPPLTHYLFCTTRIRLTKDLPITSVMGIRQAVLPAPPFTVLNASMTQTRTIGAKASTRKTSTTSKLAIPPSKPSFRPS